MVYLHSNIKMMHGPIRIRLQEWVEIFERKQTIFNSADYGKKSIGMTVNYGGYSEQNKHLKIRSEIIFL